MKHFIMCVVMAAAVSMIKCGTRQATGTTRDHQGLRSSYTTTGGEPSEKHVVNTSNSSMGLTQCPPWSCSSPKDKACKCPPVQYDVLKCKRNTLELYVLTCNCVTYDNEKKRIEFGHCGFTCVQFHEKKGLHQHPIYYALPDNISEWNAYVCGGDRRTGSLCGQCDRNHYPRVYSFNSSCIKCGDGKSNWWKYLIIAYVPLAIFYVIILLFEVNIHSSMLLGFVLFSQHVSLPPLARIVYTYSYEKSQLHPIMNLLGLLYGIWNLDFFRVYNPDICVHVGTLAALSLDLIIAVFPLFLIAITYALISLYNKNFKLLVMIWSPLRSFFRYFKRNWDIRTSTVDVLATFYFLASNKVTLTCFDLLNPVTVYHYTLRSEFINSSWRLYYDATIPYFGAAHLPYAILAIAAMTLLIYIPILILLLHPFRFFHKSISILPNRWQIYLHTFVDTFQGCYKDGTEPNTLDCRWFPAALLLARVMVGLTFSYCKNSVFLPQAAIIIVIVTIVTINTSPYKERFSSYSNMLVMFLLFIAGAYTSIASNDIAGTKHFYVKKLITSLVVVFAGLPLCTTMVYLGYWIITVRKSKCKWDRLQ